MPTSEEILAGLGLITNDWRLLAVAWHGFFAAVVVVLIAGVRPARRIVGALLVLPLISVSVLAWVHGNPFNGSVFALGGLALLVLAVGLGRDAVEVSRWPLAVPGSVMAGFGWIYPHFLDDATTVEFLYSAPTGLIPCPTLSIVVGFTLVLGGMGSRAWCLVLAVMGLFYGVFGSIGLGVTIDWVLAMGASVTAYAGLAGRVTGKRHGAKAR